jgi:hypothetical protein
MVEIIRLGVMAKSRIQNIAKHHASSRVIFPKGEQRQFILKIKNKLGLENKSLAQIAGVGDRHFREWKKETSTMSYKGMVALCTIAKISVPKHIEIRDKYWYTRIGAPLGAKAKLKKLGYSFGDMKKRKDAWKKWWSTIGRHNKNKILIARDFFLPRKSDTLAEFVGIMLGDGGMTKRQAYITLNKIDDLEYIRHVSSMIKLLFKYKPRIYSAGKSKAVRIVISSTKAVMSFHKELGLKIGNKLLQNLDIPAWIYDDQSFEKACVRGLFDTDGCLFFETHTIKGRKYSYGRLNLTSHSPTLIASVMSILIKYGLNPVLRKNGKAIQLENTKEICNYFEVIGTSNPKHRRKFNICAKLTN